MSRCFAFLLSCLIPLAACAAQEETQSLAPQTDDETRYVIYAHGKIVEDMGPEAVSETYGAYEYENILETFQDAGFAVFSELRPKNAEADIYAQRIADLVKTLITDGVAPEMITIIGASKGAYVASFAAHKAGENLNVVLIAGCHPDTVDYMIEHAIDLPGRVLAIRDRADTALSGSCARVFAASPLLLESKEIVTDLDVGHGLVYRPYPEWTRPAADWALAARP